MHYKRMTGGENRSIWEQVRRNAVALISLAVALSALSYNTWRNEKSETNRNHRQAAFEILSKLNQLQQVVFHRRYDKDETDKGNPRLGWTIVLTIADLSELLEEPMPEKAQMLRATWGSNWEDLGDEQLSVDTVLGSVDMMRGETLHLLRSLE
jgi:hypothetical protein